MLSGAAGPSTAATIAVKILHLRLAAKILARGRAGRLQEGLDEDAELPSTGPGV
jgi:hypothetical protein